MRKGGSSCGSHKTHYVGTSSKQEGSGFFNKLAVPGALLGMRLTMKKKYKKGKKTRKTRKTRKGKRGKSRK